MKKNKFFDVVAITSIVLLCIGFTIRVVQNDIFYTIKIGDLILKNGIDMKDHFSWINNLPYTYPHWLFDILINLLYKFKGFDALYIFNVICYSIIGILTYFISKKRTNNYLFSFILTIFVTTFLITFITTRAQIVSYIIFIIEKYFLDKFLEDGKKKNAFIIILMSLLLVNLHLATWIFFFILFLPPIASHYISFLLKKLKKSTKDFSIGRVNFSTNKNIPKLFIIIGLCLLTGLLTPLGLTPYTYVFNQFAGDSLNCIGEYSNLTISNCFPFFQLLFIVISIFLLTNENIELDDLFLFLGLIFMSLIAIRSFAYLLIIGMFVFSNYLSKINKKISSKTNKKLDYIFNKKIELITILICFVFAGMLFYFSNSKKSYYPEQLYPVKAVEFIKNNLTNDVRIFNQYEAGGYLLYNDIKVFIDSRSDLYTIPFNNLERDIFNDYSLAVYDLNYEKVFDYYKVTHILFSKENLIVTALNNDDNYEEIYSDNSFIIFKRNLE